ncbi:MAG: FKBP-type peptidyl-prolyl cis-trans isomerase [Muribaculaceae bacterium]|nr:FKBP-type peptidyl-prolyl cis-trans isomerase [Muribaculaceae bacterium]
MKRFSTFLLSAIILSSALFAQDDSKKVNEALATIWSQQLESKYNDSPEARKAYLDGLSRALQLDTSNPRDLGLKDGIALRDALLKMKEIGLPLDAKAISESLNDFLLGGKKPTMTEAEAKLALESFVAANNPDPKLDINKENAWVAEKSALPNAKTLGSGVVVVTHKEGTGDSPTDADTAKITYTGRLSNGTVFDQTGDETIDIPLSRVIKGFAEGLRQMKTGGHYTIYIPSHLAYGETGAGAGTIPGNAALEFEIKLIDIIKAN